MNKQQDITEELHNLKIMLRECGNDWKIVADCMNKYGFNRTPDAWRCLWRRHGEKKEKEEAVISLDDVLKAVKGHPKKVEEICSKFDIDATRLFKIVEDASVRGYGLQMQDGNVWIDRGVVPNEEIRKEKWDGRRTIKFLAISDTHLCSRWQQLGYLNEAYDDAIRLGCDFAVHCGDLTDGFYQTRPGHIYELFKLGFDDQLQYIVETYPKRTKKNGDPFITKVISGNHDHTHLKSDGANIVKAFARQRDDIDFLGDSYCKIWLTPRCDMDIQHPTDGSQYAISYSSQKLIDAMQGGSKPKIFCIGHHHKLLYYLYRNIHTFEVPCLQAQTPFERGMKIAVAVGWWIVTVEVAADGTVLSLTPQAFPRYEMRPNDF